MYKKNIWERDVSLVNDYIFFQDSEGYNLSTRREIEIGRSNFFLEPHTYISCEGRLILLLGYGISPFSPTYLRSQEKTGGDFN